MLQVLQNLGNGETSLVDVPAPKREIGHVLIKLAKVWYLLVQSA